jgi:small subunit ribosomal protein S17
MEKSMAETKKRRRASRVGTVTSDSMDKSVVIKVDRTVLHKRYKRYIKKSAKCMAHDENNKCRTGDTVEIVESRPLSARKRWRVRKIIRPAGGVIRTEAAEGE